MLAALAVLVFVAYFTHRQGRPRREAISALEHLQQSIVGNSPGQLLHRLILPTALRDRTTTEQADFLRKALADEISIEGIETLAREGRFGPLKEIFPDEAEAWAAGGGVPTTDCVAFRLDRVGFRAEVVLVKFGQGYRILRCNDVKALEFVQRNGDFQSVRANKVQ